jgi:tetratricopeptide (TPR) repeat protein
VIGNSAYQNTAPLKIPRNDAEAMADALGRSGFQVIKAIDLGHDELVAKMREFTRKLHGTETALLFYAGHAVQVDDRNYLIPVDAKLEDQSDLDFEAVALDPIIEQMESGVGTKIVFLDACRDNPLLHQMIRSTLLAKSGLARIEPRTDMLVALSAEPGTTNCNDTGEHSLFTESLLKELAGPARDLSVMLRDVRRDVSAGSGNKQVPWSADSLTHDIVLKQSGGGGNVGTSDNAPISPTATDPDFRACEKSSGDDGIAACDRAIAAGKFTGRNLSYLYSDRGFVRMQKGEVDRALADLNEAARIDSTNFYAFWNRGAVYAAKGDFDDARTDFNTALALNPDTTSKARIEEALNAVTGANAPQSQASDPSIISDPSAFGEHDQEGSASASSSYPADAAMPASPSIEAEPAVPAVPPPGQ